MASAQKRQGFSLEAPPDKKDGHEQDLAQDLEGRILESTSLGNVAASIPQVQLPRKYRAPKAGERSTFQGAGVVPVTRTESGEVRILLWQPQSGKKKGVRWWDFGGRKEHRTEFTSACACRKFASQTYGLFGCELSLGDDLSPLGELYQGLANLPLMLKASQEWAKLQLLDDNLAKVFYNDVHEYHTYLLFVPHVPAEILTQVSEIVDGGKRVFRWLSREDLETEVLCPRLHTASFAQQIEELPDDPWIRSGSKYGEGCVGAPTGSFSAVVA
jgi:hypothetical protein